MLSDLVPTDPESRFGHSIPPRGLLPRLSPWLPPVSVTYTVGACLVCTLAAHSSFADDAEDLLRRHDHSLATEGLVMFVDTASVVVSEKLLTGFLQRGLVLHHSSAGVRGHAHGGAVGIARSRSCRVY